VTEQTESGETLQPLKPGIAFATNHRIDIQKLFVALWAGVVFGEFPPYDAWTGPLMGNMARRLLKAGYEPLMLITANDPEFRKAYDALPADKLPQDFNTYVKHLIPYVLGGFRGAEGLVRHRIDLNETERAAAVQGLSDAQRLQAASNEAGHGEVINLSDLLTGAEPIQH
jgi:hypothetical protein